MFDYCLTNEVLLDWNTASEINSDYFIVEHSSDLRVFDSIGKVAAKGIGSSYSLIDVKPVNGLNYYRLKQLDKDGHVEYSKVVKVNLKKQYVVTLSPNPSKGIVKIQTNMLANQEVTIRVIDVAGNMVYNKTYSGANQFTIDISHLPNGLYLFRIGDEIRKIVLSK